MSTTTHDTPRTSILFVCLGNICRSPLAEGVFRHLVRNEGLEDRFLIDSAGTGAWHAGEKADRRMRAVAENHEILLESVARQVQEEDLDRFDLIVAMDRDNKRALESMARATGCDPRIQLLREFDPEAGGDDEVPDPYYGGPGGFQLVFEMVHRSCAELLDVLGAEQQS